MRSLASDKGSAELDARLGCLSLEAAAPRLMPYGFEVCAVATCHLHAPYAVIFLILFYFYFFHFLATHCSLISILLLRTATKA
jgi:hypothetical protein